MSDDKRAESDTSKPVLQPIPENLPEEMLPLYDWWKANGIQTLTSVAVAVLLVIGVFAFKQYRATKVAGANQEMLKASSLEELESVVAKYGSTKAGNAARIRLAKAYYDASRYEDALNTYDACLSKGAPGGFKEIAELGRAHALEGLNRLEEALTAYQMFEQSGAEHFLQPYAVMGKARVLTMLGKKDEAKKLLENLKASKADAPAWEMAIASLEGVVARYEPRAARSLFDAANDAAKKSETAAPATPAAPAPAPAK